MKASGLMADVIIRLGQPELRLPTAKSRSHGRSIGSIGNAINAMIGGIRIGNIPAEDSL